MESFSIDWLSAVNLVGGAQGLLLALVLATATRHRVANRLLAVAMLAFSVHLFSVVYLASGLYRSAPHLFGISYPLPFLFAPAAYLYVKAATAGPSGLTRWDLLLFIPFVATVAYGFPVYLMEGGQKIAFYEALLRGEDRLHLAAIDNLKVVFGVACTVLSLRLLRRHAERVKSTYSDIERVGFRWLRSLTWAGTAIWSLALVLQLLVLSGLHSVQRFDDIISLAIAAFMYGVGYAALRQPEVLIGEQPQDREAKQPATPRYERSGLSKELAARQRSRLLQWVTSQKPYLKNDLTLPELASQLSMSPHNLSEIINTELEQTFYDFINSYRVEEVKARLTDPRQRSIALLSLALDSGFNSKSSFNAAFKKRVGMTPSEYREKLRSSST